MDSDLFTYISDDDSQTLTNHHYVFPFNYLMDIFYIHQIDRALLYLAHHLSVICVFILPPSEINLI